MKSPSPGRAGLHRRRRPLRQFSVDRHHARTTTWRSVGQTDPDAFLKSVTVGSARVDSAFSLTGPASIELVLSPKGGTLEGVVLDNDQAAANANVVAVPEEKYRKVNDRFGMGATDQNGHFTIRGLAPGSYTVFAWQDLDDDLYYDADFLKSQESRRHAPESRRRIAPED